MQCCNNLFKQAVKSAPTLYASQAMQYLQTTKTINSVAFHQNAWHLTSQIHSSITNIMQLSWNDSYTVNKSRRCRVLQISTNLAIDKHKIPIRQSVISCIWHIKVKIQSQMCNVICLATLIQSDPEIWLLADCSEKPSKLQSKHRVLLLTGSF